MRGRPALSRVQRELIALVSSATHRCQYRITHPGAGRQHRTRDSGLIEDLKQDWRTAQISEVRRAMLSYIERLT